LTLLPEASFIGAKLVGAEFSGADIGGGRFMRCDASDAIFEPVDLKKPDGTPMGRKWPTNLSRCDFTGADLSGCVLEAAVTEGAVFEGCKRSQAA
jgi:uncharacterized protein YjbI with pentapeptide repeats